MECVRRTDKITWENHSTCFDEVLETPGKMISSRKKYFFSLEKIIRSMSKKSFLENHKKITPGTIEQTSEKVVSVAASVIRF